MRRRRRSLAYSVVFRIRFTILYSFRSRFGLFYNNITLSIGYIKCPSTYISIYIYIHTHRVYGDNEDNRISFFVFSFFATPARDNDDTNFRSIKITGHSYRSLFFRKRRRIDFFLFRRLRDSKVYFFFFSLV